MIAVRQGSRLRSASRMMLARTIPAQISGSKEGTGRIGESAKRPGPPGGASEEPAPTASYSGIVSRADGSTCRLERAISYDPVGARQTVKLAYGTAASKEPNEGG